MNRHRECLNISAEIVFRFCFFLNANFTRLFATICVIKEYRHLLEILGSIGCVYKTSYTGGINTQFSRHKHNQM
jgi:hypothetical protein